MPKASSFTVFFCGSLFKSVYLTVVLCLHYTMAVKQEVGREKVVLRDHPRAARDGSLLKELHG